MPYYAWEANSEGGFCTLNGIQNLEDDYELNYGKRYGDAFPDGVFFAMNPAHPKNIALADNLYNLDGLVVVSKRLREFVEATEPPNTEFLPVSIHDHKGRVASADYFVINPYEIGEYLDLDNSEVVWSPIVENKIISCIQPVFDERLVADADPLFRLRYEPSRVMVAEPLKKAIEAKGFTGLRFLPPSEIIL